ncbi:hypothetical protein ZWY2020_035871 [Hordeum vulgare]|nr:hypothetical protein ZWY2020_035871 [Hordeum vulgare]
MITPPLRPRLLPPAGAAGHGGRLRQVRRGGATTNMSENHGDNIDAMESADQEKRQEDDAHTTSYGSANINRQLSRAPPTSKQRILWPGSETSASIGVKERFFDISVSEPASPKTGALNRDQGGINTEAYSTPKAPHGTMKFDTLEDAIAH